MDASPFLLLAACPTLPSMNRIELIHPMLVHFPIALLVCAGVMRLSTVFLKNSRLISLFSTSSQVFLAIGVIMSWIAIGAGELAANVVAPTLCDREVLDDHSMIAYFSAAGFSVVLFLDRAVAWVTHHSLKHKLKIINIIANVILLASTIGLVIAGTLGASLVYQQGAATPTPTKAVLK